MGGGERYPYPKHVWSASGGWWCEPKAWKRNTAIATIGSLALIAAVGILATPLERIPLSPDSVPTRAWEKKGVDQRLL